MLWIESIHVERTHKTRTGYIAGVLVLRQRKLFHEPTVVLPWVYRFGNDGAQTTVDFELWIPERHRAAQEVMDMEQLIQVAVVEHIVDMLTPAN